MLFIVNGVNMSKRKKSYKSGHYEVINKNKYIANLKKITYRSSWELFFMKWLDLNPSIVEWGSENVVIEYIHPLTNEKKRYYTDFYFADKNGNKYIIEVKPEKQTMVPIKPDNASGKKMDRYQKELHDYIVNKEKWTRAVDLALKNGFKFRIVTEETLKKLGMKL